MTMNPLKPMHFISTTACGALIFGLIFFSPMPCAAQKGPGARPGDERQMGMNMLQKVKDDKEAEVWLASRKYLEEKIALGEAGKGDTRLGTLNDVIRDFAQLEKDCQGTDKALRLDAVKAFCAKNTGKGAAVKKYVLAGATAFVATTLSGMYAGMVGEYQKNNGQLNASFWSYIKDVKVALGIEEKSLKPLFDYAGAPYPAADVEKVVKAGQKLVFDAIDAQVAKDGPMKGRKSDKLLKSAKAALEKDGMDLSKVKITALEGDGSWNLVRNDLGTVTGRYTRYSVLIKHPDEKYCQLVVGSLGEDHLGNNKFGNPSSLILPAGMAGMISFVQCP